MMASGAGEQQARDANDGVEGVNDGEQHPTTDSGGKTLSCPATLRAVRSMLAVC